MSGRPAIALGTPFHFPIIDHLLEHRDAVDVAVWSSISVRGCKFRVLGLGTGTVPVAITITIGTGTVPVAITITMSLVAVSFAFAVVSTRMTTAI